MENSNYRLVDKVYFGGFKRVMSNNLYGFIDEDNNLTCDIIYDNISFYSDYSIKNDRIPVCKGNKWGCIDKTGKLVINIQFDDTYFIKERCFNESYNFSRVHFNGKVCVIDRIGNVLTDKFNPDFINGIFGDRFSLMEQYKDNKYSGTLIYDLLNDCIPQFWKQISGSQFTDYYKLFEINYLQDSALKISTFSEDYVINIDGDIVQVRKLSFIEKAARKTKWIVGINFLNT